MEKRAAGFNVWLTNIYIFRNFYTLLQTVRGEVHYCATVNVYRRVNFGRVQNLLITTFSTISIFRGIGRVYCFDNIFDAFLRRLTGHLSVPALNGRD